MRISEIYEKGKRSLSFEIFPPKKDSELKNIDATLEVLCELKPDFISVTYGAGGSGVANANTIDLCNHIKNHLGIETIAHLSCLYNTKERINGQSSR